MRRGSHGPNCLLFDTYHPSSYSDHTQHNDHLILLFYRTYSIRPTMAASQPHIHPSNLQIDPEANLAIYLYLRDGTKRLSMAPPLRTSLSTPTSPDTLSPTSPTTPTSPAQLTFDRVSDMTLSQLDHLQERVSQMEISNYGLLTRIYGRFPTDHQPFPVLIASRLSSSEFPERGSTEHRQLIFCQYKNMLAIAQDPTRCVNSIEPATAQGAKALQDYQLQLLLIAEQRRKQLKRKSQDEDDTQRFPH